MVVRGAHGVSAHHFHTKWCRLIVATSVKPIGDAYPCSQHTDRAPSLLRRGDMKRAMHSATHTRYRAVSTQHIARSTAPSIRSIAVVSNTQLRR